MNATTNKKPDYEKAVKRSISMPKLLLDDGERRQRQQRLSTFSDYIQSLIRADVENSSRRMAA